MSRGKRITEAEFMYAKLSVQNGEKVATVAKKLGRSADYLREIIKKHADYQSYLKSVSTRTPVRKTEPVVTKIEAKKVAKVPLFGSHFIGKRILYKPENAREAKEYRAIKALLPLQRMSLKRKAAQWIAIIDDIESQEVTHGRN